MQMNRRDFLTAAAAATVLAGVGGCSRPAGDTVRILWTGDSHGHLTPVYHREAYGGEFLKANGIKAGSVEAYLTASDGFADLARQYGRVGGYAHLATLIARERSTQPDRTLLLEAGDAWYGSAIALLTEGRAPVAVMNALGYDAMTLHWEFNLGQEALLARIKEAKFPVLAQNLVDTDFEDRVLPASLVKDLRGIKVGIVGEAYPFSLLTTELRDANPGWRMGYREHELQAEVDRVRREEGATVVILLSHMGYEQDKVMAAKLTGVDVIVGSHTHDVLWRPEQVGKTLIVQAGSHGKFLGELDLSVSGGKVTGFQHRLIPVLAERTEPDAQLAALIAGLYEPHREQLGKVIGETRSLLYRRSLFGGTTDAFMAKAYREIAGSDVACVPGWRFGTSLLPGPIVVEDVYNVMKPTPSPLYTAHLSGRQIRAAVEDNLDNVFNSDPFQRLGGDALRCAGVRAGLRRTLPRGQRLDAVRVGDAPLDDDRKYRLATSGGRTQYMDANAAASSRPALAELVDYIRQQPAVSAEPVQTFTPVD